MVSGSGFCSESEVGAARRAATHFCGSQEGGLRCGRVRQAAAIPSGNAVAANMAASCIGRRPAGPLLVMPKPSKAEL